MKGLVFFHWFVNQCKSVRSAQDLVVTTTTLPTNVLCAYTQITTGLQQAVPYFPYGTHIRTLQFSSQRVFTVVKYQTLSLVGISLDIQQSNYYICAH